MKALITGITGFVGSHLAEYLLKECYEVYGTVRWRSRMNNIVHIQNDLHLIECDVKDSYSLKQTIETIEPDFIFHLAAQSFVPTSFNAPQETFVTNVMSTINILETMRFATSNTRIQIAGSSEEYGFIMPNEVPIKETNPLRPLSPYGVSKVAEDMLGYQYHKSYGIHAVITRAFNHTGPRRGDVFFTSNMAKQIAEIEAGMKEPVIYVGNLEAIRDFTDVRDIVKAYEISLKKCRPGEIYNISTGKGWRVGDVLDMLLSMSNTQISVKKDEKRFRPSDIQILIGDCTKFTSETGWKPTIKFEKTMKDLLDYWRTVIHEQPHNRVVGYLGNK